MEALNSGTDWFPLVPFTQLDLPFPSETTSLDTLSYTQDQVLRLYFSTR